ncbi:putative outer membrane protein [Roseibium hamelinense]|uniref:Putative outer membrane protein n=1 Tax=Roseibium hamelinense TaxID=150831 RepID=A0A562SKJ3_9HYPH|nr:MipA/OmpV family protein [Roseibium hamelinense]MTI43274.1 MipA/OmpV family protein [Roseibium hamelinense]TWI81797.1 putative outer membrane protein [Roseibium hamelinense]
MTALFSKFAVAVSSFAILSGSAGAAFSQNGTVPLPQRQYVLDVGVGGMVQPRYEAADSYLFVPFPLISVGRFYVPGLGQVADGKKRQGVFFYPSFNFLGERKASDDSDLRGTDTVDWALELGAGAGYRFQNFRVFAELRQGINGHTSQTGQIGADGIFYPVPKVELSIGPRATFAAGDYMDTYFGVTAAEAAASGGTLSEYDPGGGFKSVGLAGRVSYDWTDSVRLHLQGRYDRLVGEAADSPIAKVGDENQFSIGVGVTYRFAFDVFN